MQAVKPCPIIVDYVCGLTPGQVGMWQLDQAVPGTPVWNVVAAWRLVGELSIEALRAAVADVVHRHDSLRTVISLNREGLRQVIYKEALIAIEDLGSAKNDASSLDQMTCEFMNTRFRLNEGPLARVGLIHESEGVWRLVVTIHHILADGWSLGVFSQDLGVAYARQLSRIDTEGTMDWPLPEIQFGDYAVFQAKQIAQGEFNSSLEFLRFHLKAPPPPVYFDRMGPLQRSDDDFRSATRSRTVPVNLLRRLDVFCAEHKTTRFTVLLAGVFSYLHRRSRASDIAIGTPSACRKHWETEKVMGYFANTLIFRMELAPSLAFVEVVKLLSNQAIDVITHADVPYEYVIERLQPPKRPRISPYFNCWFAYHAYRLDPPVFPCVKAQPLRIDRGQHRADLAIEFRMIGDRLEGDFTLPLAFGGATAAEAIADQIFTLLDVALYSPEQPLRALLGPEGE